MDKAQVIVLQPGYAIWDDDLKAQKADGTITLIKSVKTIIVDTGLPKDKEVILQGLKKHGVAPNQVDFVICTHGDADHIGNNNLFPTAKLIVGFDIYDGDIATFFQKNYKVDNFVTATEMTGHDDRSIGILVETKDARHFFIVDDLFGQQRNETIRFCNMLRDYQKNIGRRLADANGDGLAELVNYARSIKEAKQLFSIKPCPVGVQVPVDRVVKLAVPVLCNQKLEGPEHKNAFCGVQKSKLARHLCYIDKAGVCAVLS